MRQIGLLIGLSCVLLLAQCAAVVPTDCPLGFEPIGETKGVSGATPARHNI